MYIKFLPNQHILRYKRGKLIAEGEGLSFFFLERNTTVCAIPVSNTDTDFIFEEITSDFQIVSVQGQITYRIIDYTSAASSIDFSVNLRNKQYNSEPFVKISKRIINISEVIIKSHIASLTLTNALKSSREIASSMLTEMQKNTEITNLGISVTGFSIIKISPNKETARALEAKTREEILKQADDALYIRRNASIEQDRGIKENELNTEISVEAKKKQIKETEISTKRMILEKENELEHIRICNEVELERKRGELASLRLENAKKDADAEAYRLAAIMKAYSTLSPEVIVALANMNLEPEKMIALAFEKLASGNGKIENLNITPDLLESVINRSNGKKN